MLNIGVVGYGYWGPNVARNFHAAAGAKLVAVSDVSEKRLALAQANYPFIKGIKDPLELINSKDVDAVAIVTPVFAHHELAKAALLAGKHIFVEKPFTSTSDQARELIDLAAKKNLRIMVDHTFLFTGAVRKIKQVIDSGELGKLLFYDSVRVNLGLFQHDVNVIWDLAPHDLSIMAHVIDKKPVALAAHGSVHFEGGFEDIAYVSIEFEGNGFIAHFHVNWLSPVKVRQTLISGDKKMLVWDDLSPDEKVKIYDRGVDVKSANGQQERHPRAARELPVGGRLHPQARGDRSPQSRGPVLRRVRREGPGAVQRRPSRPPGRPPPGSRGRVPQARRQEDRAVKERPWNSAEYRPDVKLGKDVKIFAFVNLYGCTIGDGTKVGTFVEIQKNAFIGRNCKISSHTFICEGVTVEDDVFIGHNVTFINDMYPRSTAEGGGLQTEADWKVVPTFIRKGASVGSSATILAGVTVGEGAIVGAGSVVTKDVPPWTIVAGNPARVLRKIEKK